MANRINIYEELPVDPRFVALCQAIPRNLAYGAILCLWELGMVYWKKKGEPQLVPGNLAEHLPNIMELVRYGFARQEPDGSIYCAGAQERWKHLRVKSDAGLASAAARKAKTGSAIPQHATNRPDKSPEQKPLCSEPVRNNGSTQSELAEPSTSISVSKKDSEAKASGAAIGFYKDRFFAVHGRKPDFADRHAKAIRDLVKQYGAEKTHAAIDGFFQLPDMGLQKRCHPPWDIASRWEEVRAFQDSGQFIPWASVRKADQALAETFGPMDPWEKAADKIFEASKQISFGASRDLFEFKKRLEVIKPGTYDFVALAVGSFRKIDSWKNEGAKGRAALADALRTQWKRQPQRPQELAGKPPEIAAVDVWELPEGPSEGSQIPSDW